MDDPEATVPVPKPTPAGDGGSPDHRLAAAAAGGGMSDEAAGALFEAASPAFASQRSTPSHTWQPPSVAELQAALPQYEVAQFIARGGMGAVYKGTHRALRRTVAIKVLPPEIEDADLQYAERFKREAQSMAQLSHPNIVAVYDAGEVSLVARGSDPRPAAGVDAPGYNSSSGRPLLYFVMEFIEGTDVHQLIQSEKRLDPARALGITTAVCEALAFAHEEGIIHRDIKPSNIMLDKKGRVKVADFGLAKTVNLDSTMLTGSNVAMGTPDFIAPEALIAGMQVDQRADLYAVGVMLYQMLTGRIPRGRFALPSGVIPQIDPRLDAIVDKAMQTERDKRYSTAQEMKADVERCRASMTEGGAVAPATAATGPAAANPANAALAGASALPKSRARLIFGIITAAIVFGFTAWMLMDKPTATAGGAVAPATAATGPAATIPANAALAGASALPSPAAPFIGGTYQLMPGQWMKVFNTEQELRAPSPPLQFTLRDGWIDFSSQTKAQEARIPNGKGRNRGIRLHGKIVAGADPLNGFVLKLRQTPVAPDQDASSSKTEFAIYMTGLRNIAGTTAHVIMAHGTSGETDPLGSMPVDPPLAPGSEFDMEFIAIGDKLLARFNGRPLPVVTDTRLTEGYMAIQSGHLIRDVEVLNLDGLSEAEALKLLGLDSSGNASSPATSPAGTKLANARLAGASALSSKPSSTVAATPGTTPAERSGSRQTSDGRSQTSAPAKAKDGTLASSATSGAPAATKDAPFVNSLGMKFVPVSIAGGPTDGRGVLFSVWATRVQDYEAFVADTKREWKKSAMKEDFEQGPTHPAVNVSWEDARLFCQWLTARDQAAGRLGADERYRLPSDHEWSCAAGIGAREDAAKLPAEKNGKLTNDFPWGAAWPPPKGTGNYAGEELQPALTAGKFSYIKNVLAGSNDGYVNTAPVGSFPPNQLGLHDMSGNVFQWCEDWFDKDQQTRVSRGTSWERQDRAALQSSYRSPTLPDSRLNGQGFRCVLEIEVRKAAGIEGRAVAPATAATSPAATNPANAALAGASALPASALPSKSASPAYPQPKQWLDATKHTPLFSTHLAEGKLKQDGDWREALAAVYFTVRMASEMTMPDDVAVRVRFANRVEVHLRKADVKSGNYYVLGVGPKSSFIQKDNSGSKTALAEDMSLGSSFTNGTEHELVATAVGDQLGLWLDGKLLLTAADGAHKSGPPQVAMLADGKGPPSRVKSVEFGELSRAAPGAAASPGQPAPAAVKFLPGKWTKVFTTQSELNAIMRGDAARFAWQDGWISAAPTLAPEIGPWAPIPGAQGRNRGIRLRGKIAEGKSGSMACSVTVRSTYGGSSYQLSLLGLDGKPKGVIAYHGPTGQREQELHGSQVNIAPKPGTEFDLELIAIGGKLHGKLDGKPLPVVTDARITEGAVSVQAHHWVRDVEVINLDGLSEAEARQVAGIKE